jgi:hypothetical protein
MGAIGSMLHLRGSHFSPGDEYVADGAIAVACGVLTIGEPSLGRHGPPHLTGN